MNNTVLNLMLAATKSTGVINCVGSNPRLSLRIRMMLQMIDKIAIFVKSRELSRLMMVRFWLSAPKRSYNTIVVQARGPSNKTKAIQK